MKKWKLSILVFFLGITVVSAQRALPGFTLKDLGKGKVSISWINPYSSCNQIAIQRSTDRVNFRTIFSAQSPELPSNGYVDSKLPNAPKVYYRIFYVLQGGNYFFSAIKSPTDIFTEPDDLTGRIDSTSDARRMDELNGNDAKKIQIFKRGIFAFQLTQPQYRSFRDSIIQYTQDSLSVIKAGEINWRPFIDKPKDYVSVFVKDTLLIQIELPYYRRFKDSIAANTKDTLFNITTFRAELRRFIPKPVWKPSVYVYTNTNGYLTISLPDTEHQLYKIIFFDADGKELYKINRVKEPSLVLDKANFKRSGWFNFELYKNNDLIEKNKFFLQKD